MMKKLCMVFLIIAAGVLASGCIQSEPMQVTGTVAPTMNIPTTTAPVVTVSTTQVPSWSWEYTPPETPTPKPMVTDLPKMAGRIYCYAGTKLSGCVGFNVSSRDYLETVTDVSGEAGFEDLFGDDTIVVYGTWTKVSPTKVVVETTFDIEKHFSGNYDDSTSWECYDEACNFVYESKYDLLYVLMEDAFV